MKYVNRWGTMRNTSNENICEHSLNVAFIAHALGIINNEEFKNKLFVAITRAKKNVYIYMKESFSGKLYINNFDAINNNVHKATKGK